MINAEYTKTCNAGDYIFTFNSNEDLWKTDGTLQQIFVYLNGKHLIFGSNKDYIYSESTRTIQLVNKASAGDVIDIIFIYDVIATTAHVGNTKLSNYTVSSSTFEKSDSLVITEKALDAYVTNLKNATTTSRGFVILSDGTTTNSTTKVIPESVLTSRINSLPSASLSSRGLVELTNSFSSTSESLAVTAKALSSAITYYNHTSKYIGCYSGDWNETDAQNILSTFTESIGRTVKEQDVVLVKKTGEYWIYVSYLNSSNASVTGWKLYATGVNISNSTTDIMLSENIDIGANVTSNSTSSTTLNVNGDFLSTKTTNTNMYVEGSVITDNLVLTSDDGLSVTGTFTTGGVNATSLSATTITCNTLTAPPTGITINSDLNSDVISAITLNTNTANITNLNINDSSGISLINGAITSNYVNANILNATNITTSGITLLNDGVFTINGSLSVADVLNANTAKISNMSVTGQFSGNSITAQDFTIGSGDATITGDFNVNNLTLDNLSATGTITTSYLNINNNATTPLEVTKDLYVGRNVVVSNSLDVGGNLSIHNDATITGDLTVTNIKSCTTLNATTFTSATTVNATNFNFNSDKAITVTGDFKANNLVTGTLETTGTVTINNLLKAGIVDTTSLSGYSISTNNLIINGNESIEVTGNIVVTNSATQVNISSLVADTANITNLNITGESGLTVDKLTAGTIKTNTFEVTSENGLEIDGSLTTGSVLVRNMNVFNSTVGITAPLNVAPLTVNSTTLVQNLNAELLGGHNSNYYAVASDLNSTMQDVSTLEALKNTPNNLSFKGNTTLTSTTSSVIQTQLTKYITDKGLSLTDGYVVRDSATGNLWTYELLNNQWELYNDASLYPIATTDKAGIVKLSNSYSNSSPYIAVTERALSTAMATITDATILNKGIVQLSDNYEGNSEYLAVTEKALNDGLTKKTYSNLTTTSKTMVGALNELDSYSNIVWRA